MVRFAAVPLYGHSGHPGSEAPKRHRGGVIGAIQEAANGVRDGWRKGSESVARPTYPGRCPPNANVLRSHFRKLLPEELPEQIVAAVGDLSIISLSGGCRLSGGSR